jgi:hypothetical protein
MPEETVCFQLKLFAQPPLRLNGTDRQFDEWALKQRLPIANVEIVLSTRIRPRKGVYCLRRGQTRRD